MNGSNDTMKKTSLTKWAAARNMTTLSLRLILAVTICWILLWAIKGDRLPYLGYVNAAGFGFLLLMLIIVIWSGFQKKWLDTGIAIVIGGWLVWTSSGFNFAADQKRSQEGSIRVISASLRGANTDMASAALQLSRYEPKIVALQEVSKPTELKKELENNTGKKWYLATANNLAILSTNQITKIPNKLNPWLAIEVKINKKSYEIWTLRAPKSFSQPIDNEIFYRKLGKSIFERKPHIVLGDFNATPWNYGYGVVSGQMNNAHRAAGLGPGNTFPAPARRSGAFGAVARIDHIFVERGTVITNAFTGTASKGADHHPVIADIFVSTISDGKGE